jgi:hypothetical protein
MLLPFCALGTDVEYHDFELVGENNYRPTGPDPYLLVNFEPAGNDPAKNNEGLYLELLIQPKTEIDVARLQFFWASAEQSFSQGRQVRVPLQVTGVNRIFIPVRRLAATINKVRLDLENCDCDLQLLALQMVDANDERQTMVPTQLKELLDSNGGRSIPVSDWAGVELNSETSGIFTFSGWDPRIINTTPFAVPLDRFAGLYLEYSYDLARPIQSFEMFWYLNGLKASAKRSAHFIKNVDGSARQRLFLPFSGIPSDRKINHIRFDFEACVECKFTLHDSRLVGYSELEEYQTLAPKRLHYVHTEPIPKGQLKRQIGKKILVDKGFWGFYLLMVLGIVVMSFRRFFFVR